MIEWKTLPIKITVDENDILTRISEYYGISKNKLIKNILGVYLQGELQTSIFGQLQLDKIIPNEFLDEYNSLVKKQNKLFLNLEKYFNKPDIQKKLKQKWRATPKETREQYKKARTAVRSLTRKRRRKLGRPKNPKREVGRPKKSA